MRKAFAIPYLSWLESKRLVLGTKHTAEVDVTDNCNLRCEHCYHFHGKGEFRKEEFPIEVWEERFRGLHRSGIRAVLLVGGEPTLRKDVLMLADRIFPFVYVITNGTIKIPEEFNHRLFVSIDGSEKTNDSIRGDGTFSRAMENYSGDRRVVINMTLMKDNYRELEDTVRIAKDSGFGGVVCNVFSHASHPIAGVDRFVIKKEERKEIIAEMRRVKSVYPKHFLVSSSMIKWYECSDHRNSCYWGYGVLHFDVSWKRRKCFGNNADCSECGCLAGSFQSFMKMLAHPKEMLRIGFV
ncbi:MAG: radical SAM protein [Candidatus Aenigmarchaeota archaeon]|nr:radical SAM protein [Candidatus Aenigmarchaeota archaeon]